MIDSERCLIRLSMGGGVDSYMYQGYGHWLGQLFGAAWGYGTMHLISLAIDGGLVQASRRELAKNDLARSRKKG